MTALSPPWEDGGSELLFQEQSLQGTGERASEGRNSSLGSRAASASNMLSKVPLAYHQTSLNASLLNPEMELLVPPSFQEQRGPGERAEFSAAGN